MCLILVSSFNTNEIYQRTFQDANEAYYSGNFSTAINNYIKLIQGGIEDSILYFNLGNAYYHLGKKGFAIACYQHALDLNPSLTVAKENLEKVLNETHRKLALPEEPLWWKYLFIFHYGISKTTTWIVATILWVIGWIIFGFLPWFPNWTRKYFISAFSILIFLGAVFIYSGIVKEFSIPKGVLVVEKANVHVLPSENSPSRFELYEGDRFLVEREESGWALVRSVGNEKGWVKSNDILVWNKLPEYICSNKGIEM